MRGRVRPGSLRTGGEEGGPILFIAMTQPLNKLKRTATEKPDTLSYNWLHVFDQFRHGLHHHEGSVCRSVLTPKTVLATAKTISKHKTD
jgi:hypothetical protein